MALPLNATPVYTLKVPSTGKQFKYRPFLVKDEKALLIAQESEDNTIILETIKDVIKSCAKSDLDVDNLPVFDIEYIFVQIRSISVGEYVELLFKCDEDHGADNAKAVSKVSLNLKDVKVDRIEGHTNNIPLFGEVGVVMKYPTFDTLKRLEMSNDDEIDEVFNIVSECIDYVYSGEEIFPSAELKKEELITFIENLTSEQFDKLQNFFRTMPSLRAEVKYACPVCGKHHHKFLEGLESFF